MKSAFALAALLAICVDLFFLGLADRDLYSSHEGRAAQDAQTILDGGDWGLPRLYDSRFLELQKPPLYYWTVAALGRLRGGRVDAWAVRLPAAISATFLVIGTYLFGRLRGRPVLGLVAAGTLATALHFTALARVGRIDMPLALAVSAAVAGFHLGRRLQARSWPWYLGGYVALGLAVLLKGPVGAVLPAAAIGLILLQEGALPAPWRARNYLRLVHEFGLWWGAPVVTAIAAPWFLWADAQTHGQLGRTFLWYHNVERALGTGGLRAHPVWFYLPRFAFDFLPWTPCLLAAAWYALREKAWALDPEARLGACWLTAMLGVLSCAGFKRADYLLPAYPGAALVLGAAAERLHRQARHPRRLVAAFGLVLTGCAAGWSGHRTLLEPRSEPHREYLTFASEVRRHAPSPAVVFFFRVEAHALAFHVGRPLYTVMEWENLDAWAAKPETLYVIMDAAVAAEWPAHMHGGRLEEVVRNTDLSGGEHDRPLVLLRTRPRDTATP